MNPGMIVGAGLFLTALAGFGWQGYDGWLALTEIAAEAQAVGTGAGHESSAICPRLRTERGVSDDAPHLCPNSDDCLVAPVDGQWQRRRCRNPDAGGEQAEEKRTLRRTLCQGR